MSRFDFKYIESLEAMDLNQGNYLWIWHATKIPPHIGASSKGLYYSLKVSGKDAALPVNRIQHLIRDKQIPFIAIELNGSIRAIEDVFASYFFAKAGELSCLEPIKNWLSVDSSCEKLEDLLLEIQAEGKIGRIAGIHLPTDFKFLPQYTKKEINNRLSKLEDAQRREYIS